MSINDLMSRAVQIRELYDQFNQKRGVAWSEQDFMAGFVGDVGDLSKIIMAKQGLREIDKVDEKLAHELADCLWSILILADKYNIDISSTFLRTMDELEGRFKS